MKGNGCGTGWKAFVAELPATVRVWSVWMVLLTVLRIGFVLRFRDAIDESVTSGEIVVAFLHGLRFDTQVATAWSLPLLALALLCLGWPLQSWAHRTRTILGPIFIFIASFATIVEVGFYEEYGRPFDDTLLGFVDDGPGAVIATITAEYSLVSRLVLTVLIALCGVGFLWLWSRRPPSSLWGHVHRAGGWHRTAALIALTILCLGGMRGSFGARPAMRKWTAITSQQLLNDAVLNALSALGYAFKDWRRLESHGYQPFVPDGDIVAAAARVFGDRAQAGANLDELATRMAMGPKGDPPRHLFLIIMESYDLWPMLPAFASLGVTGELSALAERGMLFDRFLPSSISTMASLASIITGIPDSGARTARRPEARRGFPSALGAAFSRLGYRTRAFYGGMLSWQRLGAFCRNNGFDEVYGSGDMAAGLTSSAWGIDDDVLFSFAAETINDAQPSLNVILTLTHHPPFDVDLEAAGYPLHDLPADVDFVEYERMNLRILGHLWFADQQLGRFVRAMEERFDDALFVITGDHFGRRPPNGHSTLFETSAVPLVLYGPSVLGDRVLPTPVGSHIDLLPTLVELAAPVKFPYVAWGRDLLAPVDGDAIAIGHQRVLTRDAIIHLDGPPAAWTIAGEPLELSAQQLESLSRTYGDLHALGWWRVVRGSALPP